MFERNAIHIGKTSVNKQSVLSKSEAGMSAFNLFIENNKYYLTLNNETKELGNIVNWVPGFLSWLVTACQI